MSRHWRSRIGRHLAAVRRSNPDSDYRSRGMRMVYSVNIIRERCHHELACSDNNLAHDDKT